MVGYELAGQLVVCRSGAMVSAVVGRRVRRKSFDVFQHDWE